jgi:glutamate synthase domain-containing protein 3
MPAIGFAPGSAVSGSVLEVVTYGQVTPASGMNNVRVGKPVFVSASGFVGNVSGGFLSGGVAAIAALSGALTQIIGVTLHSGSVWVNPDSNTTASGAFGWLGHQI